MAERPAPDLDVLLKYRQKRTLDKTPEPAGGEPGAASRDLTFVIQQHAARRMHWDFRLEVDGVLASWAVPKGPSLNPKDKRMAAHVEDHPFDYGGFEGVIPKGNYGAGQVIVWDNGTYSPDEDGEYSWGDKDEANRRIREGLEAGKLSFTLRGKKLRGSWTLVRTRKDEKTWLLIKHRDDYASERDVLEDDESVLSGVTIQDLKEGRMPRMPAPRDGLPHPSARKEKMPDPKSLRPMLATLVDKPFSRRGWLFEPKLDGVRALAFVRDGKVELRSRRGNNITVQYPEVVEEMRGQEPGVYDGEIVALNERGEPDFQTLQPRINLSDAKEVERVAAETPVYYYVFDLVYSDGYDLRQVPLEDRKPLLEQAIVPGEHVRLIEHLRDDGEAMYRGATELGFEGVVGKRAESVYEAGLRSRSWLKVKSVREQEFVIGGFTEGEGSRRGTFGGLLVGYYDDGDLHFAASVGSGLTDRMLDMLTPRLKKMQVKEPPFADPPVRAGGRRTGGRGAKCFWVKPELVAEVRFTGWTREGNLRAPVFQGLREDVKPRNVQREVAEKQVDVVENEPASQDGDAVEDVARSVIEQLDAETKKKEFRLDVGGVPVKVSNLDKVFWPATKDHPERTKRDLIRYYVRVASCLLPHLEDRPLTLKRYPNGIEGKSFYQKHWPQPFPKEFHVERVSIYSAQNDRDGEYIVANNLATLVWLSQLADVEMHAWMARINPEPDAHGLPTDFAGSEKKIERSVLNYPDFMIFDLDPYIYSGREKTGEEPELNRRAFEKTREVAFNLKDVLQQLRLSSFVKTTGKTGLHIYVPVLRQYDYDEIRAAAEVVGRFMMQQYPDDITMEWQTEKRRGKVFFDHNQNARGKTLASAYSLRPVAEATASAPVTWEELEHVYPTDFDMDTLPERLERIGDLWADVLDAKQDLRALLES